MPGVEARDQQDELRLISRGPTGESGTLRTVARRGLLSWALPGFGPVPVQVKGHPLRRKEEGDFSSLRLATTYRENLLEACTVPDATALVATGGPLDLLRLRQGFKADEGFSVQGQLLAPLFHWGCSFAR